jgi:hypothetical protein
MPPLITRPRAGNAGARLSGRAHQAPHGNGRRKTLVMIAAQANLPSLDFSEVRIGRASRLFEHITTRMGQLLGSSLNVKCGVTREPEDTLRLVNQQCDWPVMKLMWVTNSLVEAQKMANLLMAWDRKQYVRDDNDPVLSPFEVSRHYYAYLLIR